MNRPRFATRRKDVRHAVKNVMFIVLGVAWVCALGPGVVRNLAQRGLAFRSPRGFRSRSGARHGLRGAALSSVVLRMRSGRRRPSSPAPRVRLSPAARRTRKRRRELLATLSGVAFGSLLLGLVPGLRMLLVLSAASSALLAFYVVALLRLKAAAPTGAVALRPVPYEYAYNRASGE